MAAEILQAGWDVFRCVLKSKGLVAHQTESFDRFCNSFVPAIIGEFPDVEVQTEACQLTYSLHSPKLSRPMQNDPAGGQRLMLPHEARLRNLTYAGKLEVDVTRKWRETGGEWELSDINKFHLCDVPVMVGSQLCNCREHSVQDPTKLNECELDAGGYFIVSGAEKVILAQERLVRPQARCAQTRTQYAPAVT